MGRDWGRLLAAPFHARAPSYEAYRMTILDYALQGLLGLVVTVAGGYALHVLTANRQKRKRGRARKRK